MKYIVDIKGEIEGDYEIIGKYEERQPGKWIYVCCYGDEFPQCSVCGEINDVKSRFCPDCGADMRGEENGK